MRTSPSVFLMVFLFSLSSPAFSYEDAPQAKPGVYGSSKNIKCPIRIKPGLGIGPLEVGRPLKEVEGVGMDLKTVQRSTTHMIAGRFSIGINEHGNVRYVEAEIGDLPDCIYYEKHKIKKSASAKQLATLFPGCGKEESLVGGNSIKCDGISITTGGWGGKQRTPALKILAK